MDIFKQGVFAHTYNNTPIPKADVSQFSEQFKKNALIFSIVDFKAKKMSQIKPTIVKTVDQSAAKEFKKWNAKYTAHYERSKLKELRTKAFDSVDFDKITTSSDLYKLKKILTKPNEFQNFGQFLYAFSCFMDVSGWAALYGDKMKNGINRGKIENLYSLPTNIIEIISAGGGNVKEYRLTHGTRQAYPSEDVFRISSFSFEYDLFGKHLYGTSKVAAAWDELQTYNKAKEREYSSFDGSDLRAILMPKAGEAFEMGGDESTFFQKFRDTIQRAFRQKGKQKMAIINQPVDVVQFTNALANNITKDAKTEIKSNLSSVWHMHSDYVFGESTTSTYDNMKTYASSSLRDGVFPEAELFFETLNDYAINAFPSYAIVADYDVFDELTLDLSQEMERLAKVDFMSDNEKRAWVGYPELEDERANLPGKYWEMAAPDFEVDEI